MAAKAKRKAPATKRTQCQKRAPAKGKSSKRRDSGFFSDDGHPFMTLD